MHWGRGCTSTRPVPVPMLVWAALLVGAEGEKKGETAARDGGCECSGGLSRIDVWCQVGQGVGQLAASAPVAAPSVPEAAAVLQCAHPHARWPTGGRGSSVCCAEDAMRCRRAKAGEQKQAEGGR